MVPEFLGLALQLACPLQHCFLRRLEHAIQPAEHRHRQDHLAVVRLLVVTTQEVGDVLDEVGQAPEVGRRARNFFHVLSWSERAAGQVFARSI